MNSFNASVPPATMQGTTTSMASPMQPMDMTTAAHMPNGTPLPAAQQQLIAQALLTLQLSNVEKQSINLIFERKGRTAEGANLAIFAVLTPVQQAAFRGAIHKLQMIAANNPQQQIPTQPMQAVNNGFQQTSFAQPGSVTTMNPMASQNTFPTTSGPITGFNSVPFNQGVTNTGFQTSPFGVRGADQI
jgi:hypothetical protein